MQKNAGILMLGTVHLVQTRIIEVSVILLHLGTKRPKGRKRLNRSAEKGKVLLGCLLLSRVDYPRTPKGYPGTSILLIKAKP